MGQRHQIYVRLPKKFYNKNNVNNLPERTIGIHHQWLYGQTAGRQLANLLKFVMNQDTEYGPFKIGDYAMDALKALYSTDIESGYFNQVHPLDDDDCKNWCENPMLGDNNNGITVIDLTEDKPKYCFMSLHHLECLDESQEENYESLEPMSFEKYLELHYPKFRTDKTCSCETCKAKKDKKVIAEHKKSAIDFHAKNKELVKFLSQFEILTKKDIKRIFPKLKKS